MRSLHERKWKRIINAARFSQDDISNAFVRHLMFGWGVSAQHVAHHWCVRGCRPIILTISRNREKSCMSEKRRTTRSKLLPLSLFAWNVESQTNPEAQSPVTCAFLQRAGVKCRLQLQQRRRRRRYDLRGYICQLYGNVSRCRCNLRETPSCIQEWESRGAVAPVSRMTSVVTEVVTVLSDCTRINLADGPINSISLADLPRPQ